MKRKLVSAVLAAVMAVSLIVPAGAASRTAVINVAYGITLEYNNRITHLTDANGKRVEPFVSNGTTYVPIRAISELFGASIDYDKETNTASIRNDYAEMCMTVNIMDQIMADCYILFTDELGQNPDYGLKDYTERVNAIINEVNSVQQTLNKLQTTNSQWVTFSVFVLPYYNKVVGQIRPCEDAYRAMRANFNTSTVAKFGDAVTQMTTYFNEGRDAVRVYFAYNAK